LRRVFGPVGISGKQIIKTPNLSGTMRRFLFLLFFFTLAIALGQFKLTPEQQKQRDELNARTQVDYQSMLDQLGIGEIRPGANGSDPNAENAANYDETKANPFPCYPDPLQFNDGKMVASQEDWILRKKEVFEQLDREMYGRTPENLPKVTWEVVEVLNEKKGGIKVITKNLIGHVANGIYPEISVNIELSVTVPAKAKEAVPVILQFGFDWPSWFPKRPDADEVPAWQMQLLQEGWGFADLKSGSIQDDNGAGLTSGIIGLANKGERRKPDQWGSLKAWVWGAGRAMDYFETDPSVDAAEVVITGHSRFGKAALVTLAYDDRFAIGYISSSGAGGASLFRRNFGEIVENVAGAGEYHWMAGNFIKYAGPLGWNDLPIDAHHLIALCAPRPVFIGGGNDGDHWVDQRGMFMAPAMASPVYELLGKKGVGATEFPLIETALISGDIAFRQHTEGHTPAPNWPTFIEFAKKYFD